MSKIIQAETRYRVLKYFKKDPHTLGCEQGFSLVMCRIITGKTHQIRKHMEYIGHPIVSDWIYAPQTEVDYTRRFCPRVFLHHMEINMPEPFGRGVRKSFFAQLPKQLLNVIDNYLTECPDLNSELEEHTARNERRLDQMFQMSKQTPTR